MPYQRSFRLRGAIEQVCVAATNNMGDTTMSPKVIALILDSLGSTRLGEAMFILQRHGIKEGTERAVADSHGVSVGMASRW